MPRVDSVITKMKKVYLKLLKASVKRKWDKVRRLHAKMIGLELELKVRGQDNN